MFDKILIANRGEIACRIIRTARRMGIRTVAVYSDADEASLHVKLADEAYHIGPAPAGESYLKAGTIIKVARESGARAVHPGYGFMSENHSFAEACGSAGISFIGPPVQAIISMGSKSAAKKIMEKAGVPLIPGYHGDDQDTGRLLKGAEDTGYPLLIKASAGGGGKGMRVVLEPGEFKDALAGARREAKASFGDDRVLIEKYLARPRHVEIQVFADTHGNTIHLFERDCSIQRRHQKIIEEAPAPGMNPGLRARMGEAATDAARAIGYVGAGTVEFLLDEDGSFYFMEMNTRLQVEHPVTEMITGLDLVEWQIRVASGEELPCRQEEIFISGHAMEARIYAEDPSRGFLPSTGRIQYLRTPRETANVRNDTGIMEGDRVSMEYDPMLAKLIVWDTDRESVLRRLRKALAEYQVVGVTTNISFLGTVAAHPAFAEAKFDTSFIERHSSQLLPAQEPASDRILSLATLFVLLNITSEARISASGSLDPYSPWNMTDGWRLNSDNQQRLTFLDGDELVEVTFHYHPGEYLLDLPSGHMTVRGEMDSEGNLLADLGGLRVKAMVVCHGLEMTIMIYGSSHRLVLIDPYAHSEGQEMDAGSLTAPMPGKIIDIMVEEGSMVKQGASLMILEAMKMEHTITAPAEGKVIQLNYSIGDQVNEGEKLLVIEPVD